MKRLYLRFLNWLYPELKMFTTEDERAEAHRHARDQANWSAAVWVPFALMCVLANAGILMLPQLGVPMAQRATVRGWIMLAVFFATIFVLIWPYRRQLRRNLRRLLNEHSRRVCVTCGYPLEQIHSRNCPECGARN